MDIKLKGKKDGIETAEVIQERYGIPSVFITAYSDQDTLERAKHLSPCGYIIKPLEEKVLEVVLELAFHRLNVERSLAKVKTEYQALLDSANDFIVLMEKDYTLSYVNPVCSKIYKKDQKELIGSSLKELFPKDVFKRQKNNIDYVFSTGKSVETEVPYNIDNLDLWLSVRMVPVLDPAGSVSSVLGISRDISGRKKAEHELKEQHDLFNTIMD